MNHRLLGGGLAAALMAATAGAASAQAAPDHWSGLYAGGGIGYTIAPGDPDEHLEFDTNLDGVYGDTVRTAGGAPFILGSCHGLAYTNVQNDGCKVDNDSISGSARVGYDWQMGGFVFGGVLEGTLLKITDSVSAYSIEPGFYALQRNIDGMVALRARAGWAVGSSLIYATGGGAWAPMDHSFLTSNTTNTFSAPGSDDTWGYQLGAGLETKLSGNLALNLEYLFTTLDDGDYRVAAGPGSAPGINPLIVGNPAGTNMRRSDDEFDLHNFGVNLIWRQ